MILMKNVHTEHCCEIHGCKYGDFDCPVEFDNQPQSYPCQHCQEAIGTDEPHYAASGWSIWKVDKGKDKKDLLDKVRQFLWDTEHTVEDDICLDDVICKAHELRMELDKVFVNEEDN